MVDYFGAASRIIFNYERKIMTITFEEFESKLNQMFDRAIEFVRRNYQEQSIANEKISDLTKRRYNILKPFQQKKTSENEAEVNFLEILSREVTYIHSILSGNNEFSIIPNFQIINIDEQIRRLAENINERIFSAINILCAPFLDSSFEYKSSGPEMTFQDVLLHYVRTGDAMGHQWINEIQESDIEISRNYVKQLEEYNRLAQTMKDECFLKILAMIDEVINRKHLGNSIQEKHLIKQILVKRYKLADQVDNNVIGMESIERDLLANNELILHLDTQYNALIGEYIDLIEIFVLQQRLDPRHNVARQADLSDSKKILLNNILLYIHNNPNLKILKRLIKDLINDLSLTCVDYDPTGYIRSLDQIYLRINAYLKTIFLGEDSAIEYGTVAEYVNQIISDIDATSALGIQYHNFIIDRLIIDRLNPASDLSQQMALEAQLTVNLANFINLRADMTGGQYNIDQSVNTILGFFITNLNIEDDNFLDQVSSYVRGVLSFDVANSDINTLDIDQEFLISTIGTINNPNSILGYEYSILMQQQLAEIELNNLILNPFSSTQTHNNNNNNTNEDTRILPLDEEWLDFEWFDSFLDM
jgi:hypothetical protein